MKTKLYRCKFKPGKLPQNWMDKEYNVIDEKDGKVLIGKTWLSKDRIKILETDFGTTKIFRKISSLTPEDGILIQTEEERQAIAPLMPKFADGTSFLDEKRDLPFIANIDLETTWFVRGSNIPGNLYKVSDFVEVKPKQAEYKPEPKPESNLAKIAKWIELNPSTTSHDLFVHLVANGLLN